MERRWVFGLAAVAVVALICVYGLVFRSPEASSSSVPKAMDLIAQLDVGDCLAAVGVEPGDLLPGTSIQPSSCGNAAATYRVIAIASAFGCPEETDIILETDHTAPRTIGTGQLTAARVLITNTGQDQLEYPTYLYWRFDDSLWTIIPELVEGDCPEPEIIEYQGMKALVCIWETVRLPLSSM